MDVPLPDPPLECEPEDVAILVKGCIPADICTGLIALSEATSGFRAALLSEDRPYGGHPDRSERKSGMLRVCDAGLAEALWMVLGDVLQQAGKDTFHGGWKATGLNDSIRILRYTCGDYFKPHFDGNRTISPNEKSFLTVLIYLNSQEEHQSRAQEPTGRGSDTLTFNGGGTKFHPVRCAAPPTSVNPGAGDVLMFDHNLYHEGAELLDGVKYVIRTDVMFTRQTQT